MAQPGRWMPRVPGPLQRLFDRFPLVTYEANELPSRAPGTNDLPTLYVFASEADARRGAPSFNPTCLKWQAFLKVAGVRFLIVPSTNHASPTGALPFLLPPRLAAPTPAKGAATTTTTTTTTTPSRSALPPPPRPVPASKLYRYANEQRSHAASPAPATAPPLDVPAAAAARAEAYQALLDGPLRNAWLHALYLDDANAALLAERYAAPASSVAAVRAALLRQLRAAADAEIRKTAAAVATGTGTGTGTGATFFDLATFAMAPPPPPLDVQPLYAEARAALVALEQLVRESATPWFFSAPGPTLFDCAVFAYIHLMVVDGHAQTQPRPDSADDDDGNDDDGVELSLLGRMLCGLDTAGLRAHHRSMWALLWPGHDHPDNLEGHDGHDGRDGRDEADGKLEPERSEESDTIEEIVMSESLIAAR